MKEVVVIGGGAAGLIAAGTAAKRGIKVTLIEKNKVLGRKLLITGKGRCNITNIADSNDLISNIPGNGNFLYSSFSKFSNYDIMDFFENLGLKLKSERGGRVFPESDLAKDVVRSLEKYVRSSGVNVLLGAEVKSILTKDGFIKGVILSNGKNIIADSVIVATGGLSYPLTGSTGDGYKFAKDAGHNVTKLNPSLVPLEVEEKWVKELMGLSLKNVSLTACDREGNKVYNDFGEMIFTHFGVSGPIVLSSSRHILSDDFKGSLYLDLKPALSAEKLDERLLRDFTKFQKKQFKNALNELLPQKLIPVIIKLSGVKSDKFVHQITKEERQKLVGLIKALPLKLKGARPIEEAIVTAGGIDIKGINPKSMESKIINGLFFAGEVLDVDGYTGGFNLTIAFSTGYTAGLSC